MDERKVENADLAKHLVNEKDQVQRLQSQFEEVQAENTQLKQQVVGKSGEFDRLQSQLEEVQELVQRLTGELKQAQRAQIQPAQNQTKELLQARVVSWEEISSQEILNHEVYQSLYAKYGELVAYISRLGKTSAMLIHKGNHAQELSLEISP
jgi:predicted nuclease with TOPRIM domain